MHLVRLSKPPSDLPSVSTLVEMIWQGQLDLDTHQDDGVLPDELSDHDRCRHERADRNQDPVVGPTRMGERLPLEVLGEPVHDRRQSITKKSVLEGSSLGPRAVPS